MGVPMNHIFLFPKRSRDYALDHQQKSVGLTLSPFEILTLRSMQLQFHITGEGIS
jgi:hypothetical protein